MQSIRSKLALYLLKKTYTVFKLAERNLISLRDLKAKKIIDKQYYFLTKLFLLKENNREIYFKGNKLMLEYVLHSLLKYYEELEEFEKCQIVHNLLTCPGETQQEVENLSY